MLRLVGKSAWGALLACCAVAGCGEKPGEPIRIGLLVSLTGVGRDLSGLASVDAANMAVDDVNARGGLLVGRRRHPIALEIADAGSTADVSVASARSLITQRGIVALVGPQLSVQAIPVSQVTEAAQIPMISPMSTMRQTTLGKKFAFRVAFDDEFQGRALAGVAIDNLHARRAAILYDPSNRYSADVAEGFRRGFEARGGAIVEVAAYTEDSRGGFQQTLARMRRARPEVLLLPNRTADVAEQLQSVVAAGLRVRVLGGDSWANHVLHDLNAAQGALVVHQWHPDISRGGSAAFVPRYVARFGHEPSVTAAATYDALALIFDAVRRCGRLDPMAIRDSLASTTAFVGVTGRITYRNGGDPEKSAVVLRVERGALRGVLLRVIQP